ncbi:MAG: HesA/MoeB/ThiF family protein [Pseudomonadota bacterium]
MVWVLGIAAGIWFTGRAFGTPAHARWLMLGLFYVALLALLVVVPSGHPLERLVGGSLGEWFAMGLLAAAGFGYGHVVSRLRARAKAGEAKPKHSSPFVDGELDRYTRHVLLREIGGPGQTVLKQAKVLVVGAGGLGSPALLYLAAAGVGKLGIIDEDVVEVSNLQRQIVHSDDSLGMSKVFSARASVKRLNPYVEVLPYNRALTEDIAPELFAEYDLILDGSDNFETRYMVNRAAIAAQKPLISAAITQWEGQISLFDVARGTPCYRCVFPKPPAEGLAPDCAEAGVLGPLPGVMGSMMAVEAVKALLGAGQGLEGRLLIYDALHGETRLITLKRRADCPDCGHVVRSR